VSPAPSSAVVDGEAVDGAVGSRGGFWANAG
jgi:hypothetical protein